MNILVSSDWHTDPEASVPINLEYLIEDKLRQDWHVVLAGDIFNALELGWERYRYMPIVKLLQRWQHNHPTCIFFLEGNHDRENPFLATQDHIYFPEAKAYVCHGHQFDLLWGWLPIKSFPVPRFVQRWYRTPAKEKRKGHLPDYHLMSMQVEYQAGKVALKKGYQTVVFGHTHLPRVIRGEVFTLANSGDMVDSMSYLIYDNGQWDLKTL